MRHSISYNLLGPEEGKAFAQALPKSSLTGLKCAAAHVLAFLCSAPAEHLHLSYTRTCGSIEYNLLGVEGGKAFAEALPKSSLTSVKCAAAQVLVFHVSAP